MIHSCYVNDDLIPIGELGQKVISRRKDGDEASVASRYKRNPISREVLTSSSAIRVHEVAFKAVRFLGSSPTQSIVPSNTNSRQNGLPISTYRFANHPFEHSLSFVLPR